MAFEADFLVDRRRLKRRLAAWQIVAVIAVVAAIVTAIGQTGGLIARSHVARLSVSGIIVGNPERDEALATIATDNSVKALIVHIDSPGGTVVGAESLYAHLRKIAAKKPVVAVMGEIATSAAYWTALGCDYILAREGTLTGSIGVILQTADVTRLLDKIGVKPESVKSSPLKAQPNPFETFTPAARQAIESVVGDLYTSFVSLVEERRPLSHEEAVSLADGRIYTGHQAVANRLIDAIGGETEARQWLMDERGIAATLPVRDVQDSGAQEKLLRWADGLAEKVLFSERLSVDGLKSVWHPEY